MPEIYIRNIRHNDDSESNRLLSFDFAYGPITVLGASLIKNGKGGSFISMPSTKSENNGKWYDHVQVDELTLLDIKNKLRQLVAAYNTRQADPEVPDRQIGEELPY